MGRTSDLGGVIEGLGRAGLLLLWESNRQRAPTLSFLIMCGQQSRFNSSSQSKSPPAPCANWERKGKHYLGSLCSPSVSHFTVPASSPLTLIAWGVGSLSGI